jgi:hypothetical protein
MWRQAVRPSETNCSCYRLRAKSWLILAAKTRQLKLDRALLYGHFLILGLLVKVARLSEALKSARRAKLRSCQP